MAGGRLVVMTNSDAPIKGDCEAAAPYKDQIKLTSLEFGAGAVNTLNDEGKWEGNVSLTDLSLTLDTSGPWVAELENACFTGTKLGKVTVTEITQNEAKYGKVREIVFEDAWINSLSVSMAGITTSVAMSISGKKVTVNWGAKVANYDPEGNYT